MGNLFEGYREGGQDWNIYSFDSAADLTPSGGVAVLNYGVNVINYSGASAVVSVLPVGIEQNNSFIYVKNNGTGSVTVSGASAVYTIDGAATKSVAPGASVHLFNYSGTGYITL